MLITDLVDRLAPDMLGTNALQRERMILKVIRAIEASGTHRVVPVADPQRGGTLGLDDGAGRTMTIVQLGDENYEAEWPVAAYIIKIHHAAVAAVHALRSYEYGNSAPDLAAKVADDPGAIPPADDDYSATTVGRHSHQRGRMSERRERKAS